MSQDKSKPQPINPDRVTNVTELLQETADAHAFLNRGNAFRPPLNDVHLVTRMLALANKNSSLVEIADAMNTVELSHDYPHSVNGNSELLNDKRFRKQVFDYWDRTEECREWFKHQLAAVIGKNKNAISALNAELDELITHVVIVPSLTWDGKSLVREDYFYSLSLAGTIAYVLMLLLDPNRDLNSKLRRCKLTECQHFFLSRSSGGRPPLYCSKHCKSISDAMSSAERTRKWRKNKTNKRDKS